VRVEGGAEGGEQGEERWGGEREEVGSEGLDAGVDGDFYSRVRNAMDRKERPFPS
jgi:hypothetical protein